MLQLRDEPIAAGLEALVPHVKALTKWGLHTLLLEGNGLTGGLAPLAAAAAAGELEGLTALSLGDNGAARGGGARCGVRPGGRPGEGFFFGRQREGRRYGGSNTCVLASTPLAPDDPPAGQHLTAPPCPRPPSPRQTPTPPPPPPPTTAHHHHPPLPSPAFHQQRSRARSHPASGA